MYNEKVMKHFTDPENFGKMDDPDAVGEVGNPRCGDLMTLYIKMDKGKNVIKDIKFETLGCAAAIATSDMIAEMAKGKTVEEAKNIQYDQLVKELGDLPMMKIHCADLAVKGIRKALENFSK